MLSGRCSVGHQISDGDKATDLIEPRLAFVLDTGGCFLSLTMITTPPNLDLQLSLAKEWLFSKQSIS